ncbi:MAG: LpqN/LpqT family lipoprotein [Rhodococcus sp. (in: high G+C Gram-positive bacteria)]
MSQYLTEQGVDLRPASHDECCRLHLALAAPPGWRQVPELEVPHAAAAYFDEANIMDGFAPNVVVLVGALSRAVAAHDVLAHGFADSRALPEWTEITRDDENFCGQPSVSISGRYRVADRYLIGRTRYTIVHPLVDQYLVQVTATISASQRDTLGPGLEELSDAVTVGRL